MSESFKALVVEKTGETQSLSLQTLTPEALMPGDVTVRVAHSTLNYKDGLVLTGAGPIARRFPMIPGIDLAGTVETSSHPAFRPGDPVLLNGYGLSETHFGGYAERARVKGDWLLPLPAAFSTAEAMAIGTAGYTAMLCLLALEDHGVLPGGGPLLVTGAAGGVGSIAVALAAGLGFEVVAATGRPAEAEYLTGLGAAAILPRAELAGPAPPLAKERWGGVIDSVGSTTLATALAGLRYGGAAAACGLAGGRDLPASVLPFILRGVTLCGIDSVMAPMAARRRAWDRLARDLDRAKLAAMTRHVPLAEITALGPEILAGRVRGRVVVDIAPGS